jgi:hypothetical protein
MKDKLYDFLDKRRFFFALGVLATTILGVIGAATKNELLTTLAVAALGLCYIAVIFLVDESTRRSYKKALRLLQDQRNSASPHWDGLVRSNEDIEPRLKLLRDRIAQDQREVNSIKRLMKS